MLAALTPSSAAATSPPSAHAPAACSARSTRTRSGSSEAVATLIEQLRTADDAILSSLTFDEARSDPRRAAAAGSPDAGRRGDRSLGARKESREEIDASVSEAGEMIEVALRDLAERDRAARGGQASRRIPPRGRAARLQRRDAEAPALLLKEPRITVSRPRKALYALCWRSAACRARSYFASRGRRKI